MSDGLKGRSLQRRSLYYGGDWHEPTSGRRTVTLDPATGEPIAEIAAADALDVGKATAAALKGFQDWRGTAPIERTRLLKTFAARIRDAGDELSALDALDAGMPISDVERDVEIAASAVEFFAGLTTEVKGETIPVGSGALNYTVRQPLGVVARIVAYNHPMMFAASRAAAPLAAGNSVILKPSDQTPLSALRLAELAHGLFPPGVFNVLTGGQDCGAALAGSPDIAKVGLIGSVPTGKSILRAAADNVKQAALELGGKNALIAFPDTDVDAVSVAIVRGMNFGWCGQSCGSTSRAFVHESIHDAVIARVVEACRKFRPGLPKLRETTMGCLINLAHRDRVEAFVESAVAEGAKVVAGGRRPEAPGLSNGAFYEATVLTGVHPRMRVAREEIFGPVLSILSWSNEDEMLEAVNDTPFGLTAAIWTRDVARAHRIANLVDVGYVWVNAVGYHVHGAPFGGFKQSGLGRDECIEEMMSYTQTKNVNVSLLS